MYLNRHSCDAFCEAFKALKTQFSKLKNEKNEKNEKQKTAGSRPKGVNPWADAPPADAWGQAKVFFIFLFSNFFTDDFVHEALSY